jgi:DAK2 domain fusion protein YloV
VNDAELLGRVLAVAHGAAASLNASRDRINDLNVYPVPDGDTGTNLSLSLASIEEALARVEPAGPDILAAAVKRAALMGARGNSGIILSQIVRGFCESIGGATTLDAGTLAAAFRGAAEAAYRAVRQPVEGTILTVIREMGEEADACRGGTAAELLDRVLARGEDALRRTPELLSTLRDAGVVDAGGAGLVEIVRGAVAGLRGEEVAAAPASRGVAPSLADIHAEPSAFRYCTNYLVAGPGVDPAVLEGQLAALGDCLIVVGDREGTKVHVHTDDPGQALSFATAMGGVAGVDIADMHAQIVGRAERLAAPPVLRLVAEERRACDVVFVVAGDGNARIAESLGVRRIVVGGQSMNPSTADILTAIESAASDSVVVLPNNRNVVLAARAAAAAATVPVEVVETHSIPAGIAAAVAYNPGASSGDNARSMRGAIDGLATGEVTRAVRSARVDGVDVHEGDWLALVDGRVVAAATTLAGAVEAVASHLLEGGRELVTALTGGTAGDADAARGAIEALAARHPAVSFEVQEGGQPHYALLLSAE